MLLYVTGINGFLGSHVADALKQRGHIVHGHSSRELDLMVPGALDAILSQRNYRAVIHCAADVGGIEYNQEHPATLFYRNMVMSLNVFEAVANGIGNPRIINIGTACSYPADAPAPFHPRSLFAGYPEKTNAAYGIAKRAIIAAADGYFTECFCRIATIIPTNMYGPRDNFDPRRSHVIPAIFKKMIKAKREGNTPVRLWGTGKATRDFMYIEDAAAAIAHAAENGTSATVSNLATGTSYSIEALARMIADIVGYTGDIVFVEGTPDGQRERSIDISDSPLSLMYAVTPLQDGLQNTYAWLQDNEWALE